MSGGEWTTQRERRQLAADQRETLRDQIRREKRHLRDLRFCAERSTLTASDWRDLLTLQDQHGKEGLREVWEALIPYWEACQDRNGGAPCPPELCPAGLELSAEKTRTKPTTRKPKGAPRKPRTDKGQRRPSYKPRGAAATTTTTPLD